MQLGGREGQSCVLAAASHVFPYRQTGELPEHDEVVEALRTILHTKRFVGKQVVSTLNSRDLSVKNIRMPEMPESELACAVEFEAGDRIAGLGDDALIRFIPAGVVPGGAETQQEIIVLAAPSAVVRGHLQVLGELELESVGLDALPCAVFRPFERYLQRADDQQQVNVFVDVGWSGARVTITRGSRIAFTRFFELGGAQLDNLVAQSLGIDPAKTAQLRRRAGCDDAGECASPLDGTEADAVDTAVREGLGQLGKEISLCLRYYAVTFRGRRPESITCVGGEALNSRYLEHLSEISGLPCRVGFPLRNITGADAFCEDASGGPMADWATAAGLALKPVRCLTARVGR